MEEVQDILIKEIATMIIHKDVKNGVFFGIHYVLMDFMHLVAAYALLIVQME